MIDLKTKRLKKVFKHFYRYDYDRDLDICFKSNTIYGTDLNLFNMQMVKVETNRRCFFKGVDHYAMFTVTKSNVLKKSACGSGNFILIYNSQNRKKIKKIKTKAKPVSLVFSKRHNLLFGLVQNMIYAISLEKDCFVAQIFQMFSSHYTLRLLENEQKLASGGCSKSITLVDISHNQKNKSE